VASNDRAEAAGGQSRLVSGWFGYWTSADEMIRIARESQGVLGEVNIFWWQYGDANNPVCTYTTSCPNQSSTPWTTAQFTAATKGLQALGIDVYASHTDLSASKARSLSNYLSKSSNRKEMANTLTDWAVRSGVDGVDLDWENFAFNDGQSTWAQTKPRFVKTMRKLGEKLHAAGKKLSVTVPGGYAPFKDGKPNPGGGYWVYAWAEIAPHIDRLRLMAYDYSWNRPGPIGPHGWADDVAAAAAAQVGSAHRDKVYVGVHQYGKAWHQRDGNDDFVTTGSCRANWVPDSPNAVSMSPGAARSLAASYGVSPRYDSAHKEYTFKYAKSEAGTYRNNSGKQRSQTCTVQKEVWFGDTATAVGRAETVRKHGIGGIAVWQLASTRSDFYPKLKPYANAAGTLTMVVSSTRPATGSKLKLTGQLSNGGSGLKVKQQKKRNGKWRTKAKALTNGSGSVNFKIRLGNKPKTSKYRLKGQGLKSKAVTVISRPAPRVSFSIKGRTAGKNAKFRGKVTPATAGQSVARQIKLDGVWRTMKTKGTNSKGKVKFKTRLLGEPQKYRYRLLVGASSKTAAGRSGVVSFRSN
ncbi:MAG: hypothetical protein K0U64_03070, partial [Actinomycetia bacterium]|nr:hypothetical protein [Actinomycetes bacterium]